MSTTVETDLHCTSCGYNLRTLSTESACPECGVAISNSIPTDDSSWHIAIRQGLSLYIFSIIAGVTFTIATVTAKWLMRSSDIYSSFPYLLYDIFYYGLGGAIMLLHLWSLWKIGTPRSADQGPLAYRRRALRISAVIYTAAYFGSIAFYRFVIGGHLTELSLRTLVICFELIRAWMLWTCISYVLSSIKQKPMAIHANVIRWIILALNLLIIAPLIRNWFDTIWLMMNPGPVKYVYVPWMAWVHTIYGVGILVIGVWAFIFFVRMRRRLAAVVPGEFGGDIRYFARHIGGGVVRGWRYSVSSFRDDGPPPEEEAETVEQEKDNRGS